MTTNEKRLRLEGELEVLETTYRYHKARCNRRATRRIRFRQLDVLKELNLLADQLEAEAAPVPAQKNLS